MALSVDIRRIVWAEVTPWEIDRDEWGVNWKRDDGYQGSDRIGTKAEAQRIVDNIAAQHRRGRMRR